MSRSPVACVLLAEELRKLRERTGLSLATLGTRTPYSRSSWSRYLKSEALPPWQAVQALCELAGEAEPRLRTMWELAEQEWSRRDAVSADAADTTKAAKAAKAASAVDATDAARAESAPPASAPAASVPSASPAPPAPAGRHKPFLSLPGWVSLVVGVILASAAFGIGSWYRSGERASTASSGVSCFGATCDGLDSEPTFCGGVQTPLGTWSVEGETELDLRYSAACRSAWGRVWHGEVGGRVSISVAGKDIRSAVVLDASESTDFVSTLMVPAVTRGEMLQVCWTPVQGAPSCRSVAAP